MPRSPVRSVPVLVLLALALGACGDGDRAPLPGADTRGAERFDALVDGPRIDTSLVYDVHVGLDSGLAALTVDVTGRTWDGPVAWTTTIVAEGDTLYHAGHRTDAFEPYFTDAGANGCDTPAACRRAFVLGRAGVPAVDTLRAGTAWRREVERGWERTYERWMRDRGASRMEAQAVARALADTYRGRDVVTLMLAEDPAGGGPLLVLDPWKRRLVPVYEP